MLKNLLFVFFGIILVSGCRTLNPSVMFKTPRNYFYAEEDSTVLGKKAFVFEPQDRFEMSVYTNEGFSLVDVSASQSAASSFNYKIDKDSLVKLPLLGKINLTGLTLDSATKVLEGLYSKYFINPFVVLQITNRVIYVFLGEGGAGKVVNLQDDHTSLVEALATAGGIQEQGKAYKIKIIRGDLKNPQIFFVDLSTMEGVKKSNLFVQSNDIVYIEPAANIASKITAQITPFVGLFLTVLLIVDLVQQ